MNFSELNIHPDLAKGIIETGYEKCMPVQAAVFPHAFLGVDIYAQSQTGTGKTAAFLVSIFQRIMQDEENRHKKALILAPTRELAVQIEEEAKNLAKHLPIKIGCFFGGVPYTQQLAMLQQNVQIMIGTPGRIIDLVQQGNMLLRDIGFLVVDEADRMFDMGFIDDIRKMIRWLPPAKERQSFLFSATLGFRVKNLAWEYMDEPKEIVIEADTVTVDLVSQELYHVASDEKLKLLLGILKIEKPESCLIFCNQKFMAEEVAKRLKINGHDAEFLMGDLAQTKRLQVIDRLKKGKLPILVATDVAARGIDVNGLDLVINYDVPMDPESYVHRIGRTARAGAIGKAITLACEKFVYGLPAIEKFIESKIPVAHLTDEMFLEDNSEGMRFGHSRDRVRAVSERQRRSPNPRAKPEPKRQAVKAKNNAKAIRPRSQEHNRPVKGKHSDPYSMSTEERMKLYKEKYGSKIQKDKAAQINQQTAQKPAVNNDKKPGLMGKLKNLLGLGKNKSN
ncbi:DEAD/DEAH box helicase [Spirochaetota bacterium]